MNSLSYSSEANPDWDKQITCELLKYVKQLTGLPEDLKAYTIYAHNENTLRGGVICELHGDILWIDSIWIEPSFRKQGIGKQLLQKVFLSGIQSKAKEIQLHTYFKEAHLFFLKCGFEDVVSIPHWKWGLTCHLMRKCL